MNVVEVTLTDGSAVTASMWKKTCRGLQASLMFLMKILPKYEGQMCGKPNKHLCFLMLQILYLFVLQPQGRPGTSFCRHFECLGPYFRGQAGCWDIGAIAGWPGWVPKS